MSRESRSFCCGACDTRVCLKLIISDCIGLYSLLFLTIGCIPSPALLPSSPFLRPVRCSDAIKALKGSHYRIKREKNVSSVGYQSVATQAFIFEIVGRCLGYTNCVHCNSMNVMTLRSQMSLTCCRGLHKWTSHGIPEAPEALHPCLHIV